MSNLTTEAQIRHDERKKIIAQGCIHTRKAGENADYDRPDVSEWQSAQSEWFDPTICEIVSEYAAWRDAKEATHPRPDEAQGQSGAVLSPECCDEFGTNPDCKCPHEHWHIGSAGTCLDIHVEEEGYTHVILTGEDEIELHLNGVDTIDAARPIAFLWASTIIREPIAHPAPASDAGEAVNLRDAADIFIHAIEAEQKRCDPDVYLLDARDCINVIKEKAAALSTTGTSQDQGERA